MRSEAARWSAIVPSPMLVDQVIEGLRKPTAEDMARGGELLALGRLSVDSPLWVPALSEALKRATLALATGETPASDPVSHLEAARAAWLACDDDRTLRGIAEVLVHGVLKAVDPKSLAGVPWAITSWVLLTMAVHRNHLDPALALLLAESPDEGRLVAGWVEARRFAEGPAREMDHARQLQKLAAEAPSGAAAAAVLLGRGVALARYGGR